MYQVFDIWTDDDKGIIHDKSCDINGFSWMSYRDEYRNSRFEKFDDAVIYARKWIGLCNDVSHVFVVNEYFRYHVDGKSRHFIVIRSVPLLQDTLFFKVSGLFGA